MKKKNGLTAEYLTDHMSEIHTFESFGRALAEQIMLASVEEVEAKGATDEVKLDAQFFVHEFEAKGCVRITIKTPLGTITKHIKL